MPCIICGKTKVDIDHIRSRGAGGRDDDFNLWELCRDHHMEKHQISLKRFAEKYPSAKNELLKKNWSFDEIRKKWSR